jgi:uncharacterized membrane-anchored protein YitT (DUF2179 family)
MAIFDRKIKFFSLRNLKNYLQIVFGAIIMACAYAFFADPFKIIPGGVFGISIILHHLFGFSTGTVGLILNIPIFILGIIFLGPKFGIKTFVGTILTSLFINFLEKLHIVLLKPDEVMLAAVISGVLIGLGLALIFRAGATTGGSDIIGQILNKYTAIPIGQLLIMIDSVVVLSGMIAFHNISLAFYALITLFITGKVVDAVMFGGSYRKAVFIISDRHREIREKILHNLKRGGTYFIGKGMFQGKDKNIIYTVVNRRELSVLQQFIKDIDPNAFITVFESREIFGEGFKPIKEEDI